MLYCLFVDEIAKPGLSAFGCASECSEWLPWVLTHHLKVHAPDKYAWAIPCSGDFHYQSHVASGINRVAYSPILKWFIYSAGMSKTAKKKMDGTVHMKYPLKKKKPISGGETPE